MLHSDVKVTGKVSIKKYNAEKQLVKSVEIPNLVVTVGKEYIASRIIGTSESLIGIDSLKLGYRYRILDLGDNTQADWNDVAGEDGSVTYAVNDIFVAADTATGTGVCLELDSMAYMAIGDDESTVSTGQTSLINEIQRSLAVTGRTGTNISFNASFGPGVAGNIKEAGIFNTGGSLAISFDGDANVRDTYHDFEYAGHPFSDDDKVTYTDGGSPTITGLTDGNAYFVVNATSTTFQLALSQGGTPIDIVGTSGATHRLAKGTMLCRTTFPLISKSTSETLAIAWVVTVG